MGKSKSTSTTKRGSPMRAPRRRERPREEEKPTVDDVQVPDSSSGSSLLPFPVGGAAKDSLTLLREYQSIEAAAQSADSPRLSPQLPTVPTPAAPAPFRLKKLTGKHKKIISLALQGNDRATVGEVCGCTPQYVTMLLRQPLAQEYIAELEEYLDTSMRGLYSKSVQVIDNILEHGKHSDQLTAARLQLEVTGRNKPQAGSQRTAEDLVTQILMFGGNVQVNNGRRRA